MREQETLDEAGRQLDALSDSQRSEQPGKTDQERPFGNPQIQKLKPHFADDRPGST
jgi:hypothetical protein